MHSMNDVAGMAGERIKLQIVHDEEFINELSTTHKTFTPICD